MANCFFYDKSYEILICTDEPAVVDSHVTVSVRAFAIGRNCLCQHANRTARCAPTQAKLLEAMSLKAVIAAIIVFVA